MKIHGFEFEDQSWFPKPIRDGMTDYLRFLFNSFKLYQPILPILKEALAKTHTHQILDLCSGSGGAMESIYDDLKRTFNPDIKISLSDLFPSSLIDNQLTTLENGISCILHSVDATKVPSELDGFRTMFSCFHHFDLEDAKSVLKNAVDARQGIAIFDGGNKSLWMVLIIIVLHPILLFFCTPFFEPFRFSRLIFTYLIPVIPLCAVWDGVVSIFRLYNADEMLAMANEVDNINYDWISGTIKNHYGLSIVYMTGWPKNANK